VSAPFILSVVCVAVGTVIGAAFHHWLAGLWGGVIVAGLLIYFLGTDQ
jgi:hypothetical protein